MKQVQQHPFRFGRVLQFEKSGDELFLDFTELALAKGWKEGDLMEYVKTEKGVEIFRKEDFQAAPVTTA